MIKKVCIALAVIISLASYKQVNKFSQRSFPASDTYVPPVYTALPLGAIKPQGWLLVWPTSRLRTEEGFIKAKQAIA